ncbi:MAG: PAS domain S-box protein [Thermodesulfobacteriota bacterium]
MMDWLFPSIVATLIGTIVLASTYGFIYRSEKKPFLAIWTLAWCVYAARFVFMLWYISIGPGLLKTAALTGNQLSALASGMLLLYGTYLFLNRRFPRPWVYLGLLSAAYIAFMAGISPSILHISLPIYLFLGGIYMWTGIMLVRHEKQAGESSKFVGSLFVLWGLHKANYPFVRPVLWLAPWGYMLAATLEFLIAVGMLMVYFQRVRRQVTDSEADLRRAQSIAQVGSWRFDLDAGTVIPSEEARRIYGLGTREWSIQQVQTIPLPEYRQALNAHLEGLLKRGTAYDIEFRIRRPIDGQIRDIHSVAEYDPEQKMVIGTIQDITDRKQALEALRIHEDNLKILFNAINESVCLMDRHGTLLAVNDTFAARLGQVASDCIGRSAYTLLPEAVAENRRAYNEEMVRTARPMTFEDERAGRWYHHRVFPILDAEGAVDRFAVYAMDITESKQREADRRRYEKELLNRNQFIETILDHLPIGLAVNYIEEGEAVYLNQKFEEIYGWPREDIRNIQDFFTKVYPDPVYREKIQSRIIQDIQSGDPRRMEWDNIEITAKTGDKRTISAKNIPLYAQNFMISTVQDITERKQLEARLQQAQKMEAIGNLAGGIAHDFNNLLFPILGMSEMLLDDLSPGSPEYENAREILRAGKRAGDLVKQILAFSRQSENKKTPVSIQQILDEVLKLARSTIPSDIDIAADMESDGGTVMADPTQLHQIAMNLITNAYHAVASGGGRITVRLKETALKADGRPTRFLESGPYAMMSVSDTGCGIDPVMLDKIFDPYFTTKEQGKGTGLGLAVVYGIVKEYRGDIRVESEVGRGTTFTVYLPLMTDSIETRPPESVEEEAVGTERILLVDDEEMIVNLETQMLERLGYQVTAHTASRAALDAFKANPDAYDLVMTDMTMPHMTGERLAGAMKSIRPDIPVIVCTGFSERISRDNAAALGIDGFLMKPIVKSELAGIVRNVLDSFRSNAPGME